MKYNIYVNRIDIILILYIYIREVKDCLAFQESSMAINMLVMRVNQAQKVKETVNNLLLSIAPRGHRVRRGNTKEKMQSCKFKF